MEHQAVNERRVRAARAGAFVHYGELATMLNIHLDNPHLGAHVGKLLGQISEDEVAAGRPMISAIVVSRDTMLPDSGSFNLGQELHRTDPVRTRSASPSARSSASTNSGQSMGVNV